MYLPIYFQSENTRTWRNWYLGQHSRIKKHNLLQSQYSFEATFHFERLLERCTNYIPIAVQARLGDISFYRGMHGDKNVVWCLKGRYKYVHKKKRTPVIFMVMEWKSCERTILGQNQFMSNVILGSHKDSYRDSAATENRALCSGILHYTEIWFMDREGYHFSSFTFNAYNNFMQNMKNEKETENYGMKTKSVDVRQTWLNTL